MLLLKDALTHIFKERPMNFSIKKQDMPIRNELKLINNLMWKTQFKILWSPGHVLLFQFHRQVNLKNKDLNCELEKY